MQSSLYVALSGQVALQKRLETIANNIANVNTGGFRAEEVTFSTVLSQSGREPTAFAATGDSYISRQTGRTEPDRRLRSTSRCRATPGSRCRAGAASSTRATAACTWTTCGMLATAR